jgi:hypothetical protein
MGREGRVALLMTVALAGCTTEPAAPGRAKDPPEELTATTVRDEWLSATPAEVDVLFVIDTSSTMIDEQEMLADLPSAFLDRFFGTGIDYHIGVTSTDIDGAFGGGQGMLVSVAGVDFVDPDTGSPVSVFSEMLDLSIYPESGRAGVGATYLALEANRDTFNAGFYREGATLDTIVISDGRDDTPSSLIPLGEFSDWYDGLKDDVDDRAFHAFIDPFLGEAYQTAADAVGGEIFDIHLDWEAALEQLADEVTGAFAHEYFLTRLPVASTIHVSVLRVDGTLADLFEPAVVNALTGELSGDWLYDDLRNSITFLSFKPAPLATVFIDYVPADP